MDDIRRRVWLGLSAAILLPLCLLSCGGNDRRDIIVQGASGTSGTDGSQASSGSGGDGGSHGGSAPTDMCAPVMPTTSTFLWSPPRAVTLGACSAQQISEEASLCTFDTDAYDASRCHAFDSDPANTACLACMFSAAGSDHTAAVVVQGNGAWILNDGGCIALIDGDTSATSCGAKREAADQCIVDVCVAACPGIVSDTDWKACQIAADRTVCSSHIDAAACAILPQYSVCTGYTSFVDELVGISDVFCGSGLPIGDGAAGAGDAGR